MAQPAGDPYWYSKVLGIHCDGANNSTTFTDVKGKTVTAAGNAKISTAQYPSLTGKTSSAYFDGSGDYLSVPDSNDWNFGTGDLTIRFWCYPTTTGADREFVAQRNNAETSFWYVRQTSTDKVQVGAVVSSTVVTVVDSTNSLSINAWNFVEVVRTAASVKVSIGGTFATTVTTDASSSWPSASTSVLYVGVAHNGLSDPYSGYMSDIEIYKGAALHTANFTPPTVPFPNTYVQVSGVTRDNTGSLASRLVRVYRRDTGAYVGASAADATSGEWAVVAANSGTTTPVKHFAVAHDAPGNPFNGTFLFAMRMDDTSLSDETGLTVTIAGNATRSSTQSKFGGYSAYFDGTGDYLSVPAASTIGTGDFTCEAWIYVTTPGSAFMVFDNRTSDNDANGFAFYVRSTSKLTFITDGTAYEGTTTVTGGAWHHVSLCRSGTSVRAFLDGNLESTTTKSNNFSRTTWLLGHQWSVSGTLSSGYIDDAFCLSGAAARTESFTPASGKFAYVLPSATENAQIYDDITPY